MYRTHTCGELRLRNKDEEVTLAGWLQRSRNLGGLLFIDLRDRYGLVQIVIDPSEKPDLAEKAKHIPRESVITIHGTVRPRPAEMINREMITGEIEVSPVSVDILSVCGELPIPFEEVIDAGEELRLKYRYLELRRPALQKNLEIRHRAAQAVRNHLTSRGFWEIETPFLMKSTPEGARDFLVPSRVNKGKFYALPQSPQTYKQLLMVSGIDKYFQLVKCFRDEDLRADRQLEFTQIDLEMSFVDEEDIFREVEGLIDGLFSNTIGAQLPSEFPRMTHREALEKYGLDKPDIRFGWELVNVTEYVRNTGFKVFDQAVETGGVVYCLPLTGFELSRKQVDKVNELARECGLLGVVAGKFSAEGLNAPLSKFYRDDKIGELKKVALAGNNGTGLFAAGDYNGIISGLGRLRLKLADYFEIEKKPGFHCLWVTEFPLYEEDDENGISPSHHPFTSPVENDLSLLDIDPLNVRSRAYDLVINGYEIASGSIRIHRREIQEKVFEKLGIGKAEAEEKFGFLLKAFEFGVPPHGGIAFGFDRLVMLMCGKTTIREIIPFPKTTSGMSLMDGSPSKAETDQLKELGLKLISGD